MDYAIGELARRTGYAVQNFSVTSNQRHANASSHGGASASLW